MKDFDVYFELFGKKMKTTILASDKNAAELAVKNKIVFHKIEEAKSDFNNAVTSLDEIADMLGMNKK